MIQNDTQSVPFIYLDNAATTPLYPEVLSAMLPYLTTSYANPSSIHSPGRKARKAIEDSRSIIASYLNAKPSQIYFTSGATESNNWVFYVNGTKKSLCTAIEHPSILNQPGVNTINVNTEGFLYTKILEYTLRDNHYEFLSTMLVNNEIGTILPVEEYGEVCQCNRVTFHVDATQGFGMLPIDVESMKIDFLSASAHKLHGPKGVGVLYARNLNPECFDSRLMFGGSQENGLRPGTENVAGIVGFAKALEITIANREKDTEKLQKLRNYLHYQIMNSIDRVTLNGPSDFDKRISNNLNYTFEDIKSDELVDTLNEKGIYCSAGSACHSHSSSPSHVLKAIGLTDDQARSSIRFSLGADLEKEDIDYVVKELIEAVNVLRQY